MRSPKIPTGKGKVFKKQWNKLIKIITSKEDFHDNLVDQLSILCDLYQEYHDLSLFIKENGYSIITEGRYGSQIKKLPEVEQKNKVLAEIRMYSKMLGVISASGYDSKGPEDNEWE